MTVKNAKTCVRRKASKSDNEVTNLGDYNWLSNTLV